MTSNQDILRQAPNLVAYALSKGWATKPSKRSELSEEQPGQPRKKSKPPVMHEWPRGWGQVSAPAVELMEDTKESPTAATTGQIPVLPPGRRLLH